MIKKIFDHGSKIFIILSTLLALFRFHERHEERKRKIDDCVRVLTIGGGILGILSLLFFLKERKKDKEHHLI